MSDKLSFDDRLGMGSGSRKKQWAAVGTVFVGIVTIVGVFCRVPQLDVAGRLSRPHPLFQLDPRIKGIPIPTVDSLSFKNTESKSGIEYFLDHRDSRNQQAQEIAEKYLQKVLRDERDNAPATTVAYLLALYGQYDALAGRRQAGIEQLEQACRLAPEDLLVKALLLRVYEEASRYLEAKPIPWPLSIQEQIRGYGLKIEALRRELKPFLAGLAAPARDLGCVPLRREWLAAAAERAPCNAVRTFNDAVRWSDLSVPVPVPVLVNPLPLGDGAQAIFDVRIAAGRGAQVITTFTVNNATTFAGNNGNELFAPDGDRMPTCSGMGKRCGEDGGARHVLAVGINVYDAGSGFGSLAYARSDADRTAQAFARLGYTTTSLLDGLASRERILNSLAREALVSRPGDDFVFYFSGHGFSDAHGNGALAVTASDGSARVQVVSFSEVAQILSFYRGTATVIIDGCLNDLNVDLGNGGLFYGHNRARFIVAEGPGRPALESQRLRAGLYAHALCDFLDREASRGCRSKKSYRLDVDALFASTSVETARLARELYGLEQSPREVEIPRVAATVKR
jgi:tetratricopeptide (TPR) repeat protein